MDEHNELRTRLRAVGMELFRRDGLRFTMQQAAAMMHISKKTIYAVYPSKEALLLDMVDDAFTRIHARKQRILDGPGTLAEKLRAVIIALPEEYTALDLQQMDLLDEKYPRVAARVREHLETGWEPTLALLEQAMGEGVIRRVSLPVLQRMISASIEDFLADRTLDAQGISYTDALDEMISILLEGRACPARNLPIACRQSSTAHHSPKPPNPATRLPPPHNLCPPTAVTPIYTLPKLPPQTLSKKSKKLAKTC